MRYVNDLTWFSSLRSGLNYVGFFSASNGILRASVIDSAGSRFRVSCVLFLGSFFGRTRDREVSQLEAPTKGVRLWRCAEKHANIRRADLGGPIPRSDVNGSVPVFINEKKWCGVSFTTARSIRSCIPNSEFHSMFVI